MYNEFIKKEGKLKRFNKLDSVKLNKYLNENKPLYDIAYLFPYMTTRPIERDIEITITLDKSKLTKEEIEKEKKVARLKEIEKNKVITLRSFKGICKRNKYCYKIQSDTFAIVRQFLGTTKGSEHVNIFDYVERRDIDNRVYAFGDIDPYDMDSFNFEVIYSYEDIYLKFNDKLNDNFLGEEYKEILISNRAKVNAVIEDLKKRRMLLAKIDELILIVKTLSVLPIKFKDIPEELRIEKLNENDYVDFRMRILLAEQDFYKTSYKIDNDCDIRDEEDRPEKRTKIESSFTIIHKPLIDTTHIKYRIQEFIKFHNHYGDESVVARENASFLIEDFLGKPFIEFLRQESDYYLKVLDNYSFLLLPYSEQYKSLFKKYRLSHSKWQTQQIFRKFKSQYKQIQEKWEEHKKLLELISYEDIEQKLIDINSLDLGDNGTSNKGFGYHGDGTDTNDIMEELRDEKDWEIRQEKEELQILQNENYQDEEDYYIQEYEQTDEIEENDEDYYDDEMDTYYETLRKEQSINTEIPLEENDMFIKYGNTNEWKSRIDILYKELEGLFIEDVNDNLVNLVIAKSLKINPEYLNSWLLDSYRYNLE